MSEGSQSVGELKAQLRARMRAVRRSIPDGERRELGSHIEERLVSLPEIRGAGTILLFYSFGTEVETSGIASALHDRGTRLLLPYLEEGGMKAAEVRAGDPLVPTTYGPKEPARRVAVDPSEVEAVVTPGLAFDRSGHRLGYGGGHYDRYLSRIGVRAFRVGICFAAQLVETIPAEASDEPLHAIVTDAEVIRVGP